MRYGRKAARISGPSEPEAPRMAILEKGIVVHLMKANKTAGSVPQSSANANQPGRDHQSAAARPGATDSSERLDVSLRAVELYEPEADL